MKAQGSPGNAQWMHSPAAVLRCVLVRLSDAASEVRVIAEESDGGLLCDVSSRAAEVDFDDAV